MTTKTKKHLGVGLYSLAEASRIIGEHPSNVHRWLKPEEDLVPRYFDAESTITFSELMELLFIKVFRGEGVSLQTIRLSSVAAAKKYNTDYPFAVKRFDTDGKAIFATLIKEQDDSVIVEDLRRGQLVFEQVMRPLFKKLEYNDKLEVARYWPLEKNGRIVLDPSRKLGKPIDAETGVRTSAIYDALRAGGGQDDATVADWLGIPVEAVHAAAKFEQSLVA